MWHVLSGKEPALGLCVWSILFTSAHITQLVLTFNIYFVRLSAYSLCYGYWRTTAQTMHIFHCSFELRPYSKRLLWSHARVTSNRPPCLYIPVLVLDDERQQDVGGGGGVCAETKGHTNNLQGILLTVFVLYTRLPGGSESGLPRCSALFMRWTNSMIHTHLPRPQHIIAIIICVLSVLAEKPIYYIWIIMSNQNVLRYK